MQPHPQRLRIHFLARFHDLCNSVEKRFFMDICSGASSPVSSALGRLAGDRVVPIDLIFGIEFDLLNDDSLFPLTKLAASGLIGAGLAAPYCKDHSAAKLIQPGPPPIRRPGMLEGLPGNTFEQRLAVQTSAIMHDRCRRLLSLIEASGGLIILENPVSSMTFLDELMLAWLHAVAPFGAQAFACRFGMNWKKRWLFMSNHPSIHEVGLDCCHDKSSHDRVAGVRLADGSWLTQKTAEYPVALADALAHIILPWVSNNGEVLQLHSWEEALPPRLTWRDYPARIEDGGGLTSTARHIHPIGPDRFQLLRKNGYPVCVTKNGHIEFWRPCKLETKSVL